MEYKFGMKLSPIILFCFNKESCWDTETQSPVKDLPYNRDLKHLNEQLKSLNSLLETGFK